VFSPQPSLLLPPCCHRVLFAIPAQFDVVSPKKGFKFAVGDASERLAWQVALRMTLDGLPVPVFREINGEMLWDPLAPLTSEQLGTLGEFRTQILAVIDANASYTQAERDFINDATLLRFLR
jgi:hypothetical protein